MQIFVLILVLFVCQAIYNGPAPEIVRTYLIDLIAYF